MNVLNANEIRVLALAAFAAVAAGCGPQPSSPLNYYDVRLEADASNPQECREAVAVQLVPVKIEPQPAGTLYQTEGYLDRPLIVGKPVEDGPGNWECWFTYRSRDVAPGTWRIVGEFNSGSQSCERSIAPGQPNRVRLDQEEGCVEFSRQGNEVEARNVLMSDRAAKSTASRP